MVTSRDEAEATRRKARSGWILLGAGIGVLLLMGIIGSIAEAVEGARREQREVTIAWCADEAMEHVDVPYNSTAPGGIDPTIQHVSRDAALWYGYQLALGESDGQARDNTRSYAANTCRHAYAD